MRDRNHKVKVILEPLYRRTAAMSLCTLPILFFNLGGEMLYILDQRLRAQKVGKSKSAKGTKLIKTCNIICKVVLNTHT